MKAALSGSMWSVAPVSATAKCSDKERPIKDCDTCWINRWRWCDRLMIPSSEVKGNVRGAAMGEADGVTDGFTRGTWHTVTKQHER
jgi:hypothetical protein